MRPVSRRTEIVILDDRGKELRVNEVGEIAIRGPQVMRCYWNAPGRDEVVALFVVRRDGSLTAEALLDHCSKHLTRYKLPRRIEFREQLPKTAIGKTRRRLLREEIVRDVPVAAAASA